jgi:DNA invertase Pin-like site-specific DNA recombinase
MPLQLRSMIVYYGVLLPSEARKPMGHSEDRATAERFAREHQGHIIEHYLEEGRTRRAMRPKLIKAIQHARVASALLVIPRFDPLGRDIVFLKLLWDSRLEFVACDNHYANQTTLPLLASLVEKESRRIAARTQMALAKRKRQRERIGTPQNLTHEARLRGARATAALYSTRLNEKAQTELLALRAQGKSLRQIATIFNQQGYQTKTGRSWSHTVIKRLLDRHEEVERNRKAYLAKRADA